MPVLGETGVVDESSNLVLWKIADFFSLSSKVGDRYGSDTFSFAGEKWYLEICPGGCTAPPNDFISVYLGKKTPETKCSFCFTLDLKKTDGSLLRNDRERVFYIRAYSQFLARSELLRLKSELAPSDVLIVTCTIRKGDLLPATSMEFSEPEKLSKNFEKLKSHKKSCDVTLVVQGKSFQVHKAVLIARSSVFSAMFEHEMSENITGTVDIPDCDEESFGTFLEYLYSGRVKNVSFGSTLQLYRIAHKYDVQELKSSCLKFLKQNLTVEGVIDAVVLADEYDEAELLALAQNFFNSHFEEILSTEQWETLNRENFCLANKLNKGVSSYLSVLKQQVANQSGE